MWKKLWITVLTVAGLGSGCTNHAKTLELEGAIYLKGSAPHTYLVLEDTRSHRMYRIANPTAFDLIHRQRQRVKVEAKLLDDDGQIEVLNVEEK